MSQLKPVSTSALWRIGWRFLIRHKWQSALMVLGIALGVAVIVAIDLANASAAAAFQLSTETLTGKATHQINGGPRGVDEQVFVNMKRSGWSYPAAPVISVYASSPQLGGTLLQLLGIDPFSDTPFRSFLGSSQAVPIDQMASFLTRPGAILLSKYFSERYNLSLGDTIVVETVGRSHEAVVAGFLDPVDTLSKRTLEGVILADISTAQELAGLEGWVSRVDLILPEGDTQILNLLQAGLPAGYQIIPASARSTAVEQMTDAFRVNLTALSLLALVVGLFLIYNTMTFSVVQRRELFGTLRCLGVTRLEVFGMVIGEAVLVGAIGSLIGIGLGIFLGQVTVGMVSQTINDLYYTTTVRATGIPPESLIKGGLLGLLATVGTAALPAWEAASVPPRAALLRSGLEGKTRRSVVWAAAAGLVAIGAALYIFTIPGSGLWAGFGGTLLIVLGAALVSAYLVVLFFRGIGPITGRMFGVVGKMAPRSLLNSLSRTAVAVIALMVAVAVTVGVSIMIDSFRHTVVVWLEQTLESDIYISTPIYTETIPSAPIDPEIVSRLKNWPDLAGVSLVRTTRAQTRQGQMNLSAVYDELMGSDHLYLDLEDSQETVWGRMQNGDVMLSETLANRLGIKKAGTEIELNTLSGWRSFKVIGIYYDYASSEGMILMAINVYQELWKDDQITAIGLRLLPGQDVDSVALSVEDALKGGQSVIVRANSSLRKAVLEIFDRTFAITIALRVLATLVAFVGVLSALFLLQIEKQREVGILRALGLTGSQLRKMVFLETGLMGLAAGLLSLPTGIGLSLILIYVINKRSFGWTLQLSIEPGVLLQGILVAMGAALLAAVYPAWRLSRIPAAEAIRYE